jgi:hypothetical protein
MKGLLWGLSQNLDPQLESPKSTSVISWAPKSESISTYPIGEKVKLENIIETDPKGIDLDGISSKSGLNYSLRWMDSILSQKIGLISVKPRIDEYLNHIKKILKIRLEKENSVIQECLDYISEIVKASISFCYRGRLYYSTSWKESLKKYIITHPEANDIYMNVFVEITQYDTPEMTSFLIQTLQLIDEYIVDQNHMWTQVERVGEHKVP